MSGDPVLAELEAVTAALPAAAGDPSELERLGARREALATELGRGGCPPTGVRELAAAIRRVLALDMQVLAALHAQRAVLAAELDALGTGRRALRSYRGAAGVLPVLDAAG
jgi:hypothetical protein